MTVAKDSRLEIYRGFPFSVTYTVNDETGNPIDLSGKTFSAKAKNFDDDSYVDVGTVYTQYSNNVGTIKMDLEITDTEIFTTPEYEPSDQRPDVSAKILILDEDGIPYLDINVAVMG